MTTAEPLWTIAELAEAAASALDGADEPTGQRSGRVRDVPDPRTIRWYQTTGLVDRPAALRGRTALYGRRHLAQLVAIKRLQYAGHPLATIQAELAGSSDEELERLAGLPAASAPATAAAEAESTRPRFWATRAAAAPAAAEVDGYATHESGAHEVGEAGSVQGVRLGSGVLLVLDGAARPPDAADLDAVLRAAQPVLDTLRERGLLGPAVDSTKESA